MKDPQWAKEWGGMVYEMIGDIAIMPTVLLSIHSLETLMFMKVIHGHQVWLIMNMMRMES